MGTLTVFDTPARLAELSDPHRQAWSQTVAAMVARFVGRFPQFYDPTSTPTPDDLGPVLIVWGAFPARVLAQQGTSAARWARADSTRDEQDEYCEWSVTRRDDGTITRVTFTTEVPEYWEHLAQHDPDQLLALYQDHVDPRVASDDLFENGRYVRKNPWNASTEGRLAHLTQQSNALSAAIQLVAEATVLREREDGTPITDRQELVSCGGLGDPLRSSDPQIAEIVNDAADRGAEVTLLDPFGLYLDGLQSSGMRTPDGADAADFWHVERGTPEHTLRASFAVPHDRYAVGDITIGGRPIEFGAQVADKVRVRIGALAKPANHQPMRQPCNN